ncbi:MAG: Nif3-like dinuclear metal center hexameric protein [Clostridia bacterium]|nr:Nif3-like dinuclear metal center hexameric protein [Clostridia bacterium]
MKIREIYEQLHCQIPPSLSCEWDNDGLMCCPDGEREVKRVLVTLDVTEKAVKYALEGGYDLIVSHHPLIFKGLRALSGEDFLSEKVLTLIRSGIAVFSFHTRLDAVEGGVNDVLAGLLGLERVTVFGNGDETLGRIGELPCPMTADAFAETVKHALDAPFVLLADAGLSVKRVAVLGGGGEDDIAAAKAAGADTYVTGELKYHSLTDGPEAGMNLIAAGHFYTEFPVCRELRRRLLALDPALHCEIYFSNTVRTV